MSHCISPNASVIQFQHPDFELLICEIHKARSNGGPVTFIMGGYPIKLGLSLFVIDLMEQKWITHLAMNGAEIILDFEVGLLGGKSENVQSGFECGNSGSRKTPAG